MADGKVSSYLHDQLQVGDSVELFAPAGAFTLAASERPLALICAGVGITPMLPMLEQALAAGRQVHLVHCTRNSQVRAFADHLAALRASHPQLQVRTCYSEPLPGDSADAQGLLSTALLGQWLPGSDIDAYIVGPQPFMAMVQQQLRTLGVADERMHHEFFGPAATLAA